MDYTFDQIFNASFAWAFGVMGGLILAFIAIVILLCVGAYVVRELF